ncbi:MAG: lipid A biosynthesis lauroyl acyltransferase [Rhodospirillaceae bacterium]
MLRRLIHILEALALYVLFILMRMLPLRTASAMGGALARTFGPLLGATKTARRNLKKTFPEKSDIEIDDIIKKMWDNLGRTIFEYPHLDQFKFDGPDANVEVVRNELIVQLRDDNKPGIFFSGHFANWEVLALAAMNEGIPIHLIYRAPNNPYVENVFRQRQVGRGELIPKGSEGARQAIKLLNGGGHLGMLVDQKMNDGIPIPFFGRDAMTAPALAQFALKFDMPVLPVQIERIEGVRFRITCYPPLPIRKTANRQDDIKAAMTNVNKIMETWARQNPEQWLWIHNRWPD